MRFENVAYSGYYLGLSVQDSNDNGPYELIIRNTNLNSYAEWIPQDAGNNDGTTMLKSTLNGGGQVGGCLHTEGSSVYVSEPTCTQSSGKARKIRILPKFAPDCSVGYSSDIIGWYNGLSLDLTYGNWQNLRNNNDYDISQANGTLEIKNKNGHKYVRGYKNDIIEFAPQLPDDIYTAIFATAYLGTNQNIIIECKKSNCAIGHKNGLAGILYQDSKWQTSQTSFNSVREDVLSVVKSGYYRINGYDANIVSSSAPSHTTNDQFCINCYATQKSDFDVFEVIILSKKIVLSNIQCIEQWIADRYNFNFPISKAPTPAPTVNPTFDPTNDPTYYPTAAPSINPTKPPSIAPSLIPTQPPSVAPTQPPSQSPSVAPSMAPTACNDLYPSYNSNDGINEVQVTDLISNVDFMYAAASSEIIVADSVAEKVGDMIYLNETKLELKCGGLVSCFQTHIFCANECNILCSGQLSCSEAIIYANDTTNLHVICTGQESCKLMKIYSTNVTNRVNIDCVSSFGCVSMDIQLNDNEDNAISCYDINACDNINIFTNTNSNTNLILHSYSNNIVYDNGYGLNRTNPQIDCITDSKFVRYNSGLIGDITSIRSKIENEYENMQFPCDNNIKILCNPNNTISNRFCTITYSISDHSISPIIQPLPQCYWVSITDLTTIQCPGTCSESPTYDPTSTPTFAPSVTTISPTNSPSSSPSNYPSISPSQPPSNAPTFAPSYSPSNSPTQPPTNSPSNIPSKSPTPAPTDIPTYDPTNNPTFDPTFEPTINPTFQPTNAPSISPSYNPSIAPSISPSLTPTHPPTNNPSISPSLSPTNAPSIAPSITPSIAPTLFPSLNPSISPSITPSITPSNAPTLPPTNTPSIAPSNIPSNAPTYSPTMSPTRIPTTDEKYPAWIDIIYQLRKYTETNIKFMVNNSFSFVETIEEILEHRYFDSVGSYTKFYVNIYQINDVKVKIKVNNRKNDNDRRRMVDINENELQELEIDDLWSYNLEEPMIMKSEIITRDSILGGSLVTRSSNVEFLNLVQTDIRQYLSNDEILFSVPNSDKLEVLEQYDEPIKKTDWTVAIISFVIVFIGLIIGTAAFMNNRKKTSYIDNAAFLAPILVSLQIYDLLSDLNLSFSILSSDDIVYSTSNIIFWCGIGTLAFTIIPFMSNIFYAMTISQQNVITSNTAASAYFKNHLTEFVLIVVFTGGCFPALSLMSSRIFAMDIFNSGLTKYELSQLSKIKIRSTITLENGPQLILQIIYSSIVGNISPATYLAFTASVLSVIATLATFYAQSHVNKSDDNVVVLYSLYFGLKQKTDVLNKNQISQIGHKKERKGEISKCLCSLYQIPNGSIEIGYVKIISNGIIINMVHHIWKEQLKKFQKQHLQNINVSNQMFNIEIDPEFYTQKLCTMHATALNNMFCDHFCFDNCDKFIVKYSSDDIIDINISNNNNIATKLKTHHSHQRIRSIDNDDNEEQKSMNIELMPIAMTSNDSDNDNEIDDTINKSDKSTLNKIQNILREQNSKIDDIQKQTQQQIQQILKLMEDEGQMDGDVNETTALFSE